MDPCEDKKNSCSVVEYYSNQADSRVMHNVIMNAIASYVSRMEKTCKLPGPPEPPGLVEYAKQHQVSGFLEYRK